MYFFRKIITFDVIMGAGSFASLHPGNVFP